MECSEIQGRVLLVAIGNEFRCDDGVGLVVGCRVRELNLSGVEVLSVAGEGGDLLSVWKNCDTVILVDAVRSGSAVGTIHCIDLENRGIPSEFSGTSTHALGIAESVELARVLGTLPRRCLFVGIEVANVGMGTKMSRRVITATDDAVRLIRQKIGSGVGSFAPVI